MSANLSLSYWAVRVIYIFQLQAPYQANDLQIFSPMPWVLFVFSMILSLETQEMKLRDEIQFIICFFLLLLVLLLVSYLSNHGQIQGHLHLCCLLIVS